MGFPLASNQFALQSLQKILYLAGVTQGVLRIGPGVFSHPDGEPAGKRLKGRLIGRIVTDKDRQRSRARTGQQRLHSRAFAIDGLRHQFPDLLSPHHTEAGTELFCNFLHNRMRHSNRLWRCLAVVDCHAQPLILDPDPLHPAKTLMELLPRLLEKPSLPGKRPCGSSFPSVQSQEVQTTNRNKPSQISQRPATDDIQGQFPPPCESMQQSSQGNAERPHLFRSSTQRRERAIEIQEKHYARCKPDPLRHFRPAVKKMRRFGVFGAACPAERASPLLHTVQWQTQILLNVAHRVRHLLLHFRTKLRLEQVTSQVSRPETKGNRRSRDESAESYREGDDDRGAADPQLIKCCNDRESDHE